MKKCALFLLTAFVSFNGFAQKNIAAKSNKNTEKTMPAIGEISNGDLASITNSPTVKAKNSPTTAAPDPKYAKIKIIESYERVLEKGYKTEAMLTKVADYRFFDGDLNTAAKWYAQLFEFCPDELEAVYYYRYAKSLDSIGQTEKAKEMMALFQNKKG